MESSKATFYRCPECGGWETFDVLCDGRTYEDKHRQRKMEPVEMVVAAELTKPGDEMQSALSRLASYVLALESVKVPYEVDMAAREGRDAVEDWTKVRRSPP